MIRTTFAPSSVRPVSVCGSTGAGPLLLERNSLDKYLFAYVGFACRDVGRHNKPLPPPTPRATIDKLLLQLTYRRGEHSHVKRHVPDAHEPTPSLLTAIVLLTTVCTRPEPLSAISQ